MSDLIERALSMHQDLEDAAEHLTNDDVSDVIFKLVEALEEIGLAIHYPKCWDTVAYPSLVDAITEITHGCTVCECKHGESLDGCCNACADSGKDPRNGHYIGLDREK